RRKAKCAACNDVFSGGTQLNWPAKIGTQSRGRRAGRIADTSVFALAPLATIRKADASYIDLALPTIGVALVVKSRADRRRRTRNSTRERARRISATGNRIPEVQQTSSARDRLGPHRIFEFGE